MPALRKLTHKQGRLKALKKGKKKGMFDPVSAQGSFMPHGDEWSSIPVGLRQGNVFRGEVQAVRRKRCHAGC